LNFRYKVVETQTVTDDVLEELINRWVAEGWQLDGVKFAMSEASRRPSMAFILFVREENEKGEEQGNDI
jgi:hypothetical protein